MFIAALFKIARTWKQPKYSTTEERIKKMWYICTKEYYSALKRNEIGSLWTCAWTWRLSYRVKIKSKREK